jgi:argininosuccinate lyase
VRYSIKESRPLHSLTLEEWQRFSPQCEADVTGVFDFEHSVEQKASPGGTARSAVEAQISQARQLTAA